MWAILDLTKKEWVATGTGSTATVQVWPGANKAAATTAAANLNSGTTTCTTTIKIATPVPPSTINHITRVDWDAANMVILGGHYAPTIQSTLCYWWHHVLDTGVCSRG
jgi:hypothetical protein